MGFHFDGLDIGKHVQPEESHNPDEAHPQPGRHKHEVHKLNKKKIKNAHQPTIIPV